ncbi:MAG: protocatechuate 3,4-dioxygenase subunit alpha [Vicinamibacterales bacterium]
MAGLTPFQTLGPFFDFGLVIADGDIVARPGARGRQIVIEGVVRDGAGDALPDALVEVWQANDAGKYRHPADEQDRALDPAFDGFGRVATDACGKFHFTTVVPGRVPGPEGQLQAPHLAVGVLARGLLTRLVTRMYFDGEPSNAEDSILALVPAERRSTLVAKCTAPGHYRFDINLQGEGETVFFDV